MPKMPGNRDPENHSEIGYWIQKRVNCCACGNPMSLSRYVNFVNLKKRATWKYPTAGNVLTGQPCIEAIAVVCDDCIEKKVPVRYAVEWNNKKTILKYHPIEILDPLP